MTGNAGNRRVHVFRDDALGEHDATALAGLIESGELRAREVFEAAIARIEQVDPLLNAVARKTFDTGRGQAANTGGGAFAGVPLLIKDNIDLAGVPTGHGSKAVHPRPAAEDSVVVRQVLDQGFTVPGKSRLPAFGLNASTEFMDEPPTRNPWHTGYSAGASSGGAAALVASGAVPIAHGNDGGGSIRIPAACCGLVGLKPTRGRLKTSETSRSLPVNLISEGVLTRSVRDTARFFAAAEGYYRNPRLPAIGDIAGPNSRRLRVGVITDSITDTLTDAQTRKVVEDTAALLSDLGHEVVQAPVPLGYGVIQDFLAYWGMMAFMVRTFGKRAISPDFNVDELDDLTVGLADYYRKRILRTPGILWRLQRTWQLYARSFRDFDAVLSPVLAHTTPELGYLSPALPFDMLVERLVNYVSFTPANNTSGGPAISLPMGQSDAGLPIGVQLAAVQGDERTLLELAFELEQAQPWPRIQG